LELSCFRGEIYVAVARKPSVLTATEDSHAFTSEAAAGSAPEHVSREFFVSSRRLVGNGESLTHTIMALSLLGAGSLKFPGRVLFY
jgi:hypothetical protein